MEEGKEGRRIELEEIMDSTITMSLKTTQQQSLPSHFLNTCPL
jgi:hypothetical protein